MKTKRFPPGRSSCRTNRPCPDPRRVCGRLAAWLMSLTLSLGLAASAADLFVELRPPGWSTWSRHSWAPAWGDFDRDGFLDAFVPRSLTSEATGGATNLLYRNQGDGGFRLMLAGEVGAIAADEAPSFAGLWGDANNDGLPDLFVVNMLASSSSPPMASPLYLNQGNGTFTSIDAGALTQPQYTYGFGSWCDYDRDGWLDVFLCAAWVDSGHRTNLLFRGLGDGRFGLVTEGAIATDKVASGFSNEGLWTDLNGDGAVDLLVANWPSPAPSFVYRNDGSGRLSRLTNSILEARSYSTGRYAVGDLDNDGDMDVVASGLAVRVFMNDGGGEFTMAQEFPALAPAACADYDNDGHLDLVLFRENTSSEPLDLYHNNGDGTFSQVQDAMTRTRAAWMGGPWIDVDNDGFLDLVVARKSGGNFLYRNQGNGNHWLKFRLQGTTSNRSAIGAKVRVRASIGGASVWQLREMVSSTLAEDGLRPHFGLGDATLADEVRIEWPSGTVQVLQGIAVDQLLVVTEPAILLRCALQAPGIRLEIHAMPTTSYDIQTSPDLRAWSGFLTLSTDASGVAVTEVAPAGDPCRFYRAVQR